MRVLKDNVPALMLIILSFFISPAQAEPAKRIASMNLCTDQLVVMLADKENIVSLSYAAADPAQSLVSDQINGIPLNYGHAEEIVPLAPDLVFSGAYTTPFTDQVLKNRGIRVVDIKLAESLDDIRRNITIIADEMGLPRRGALMISAMDAELLNTAKAPTTYRGIVLIAGGFTPGRRSIAHDILTLAGIKNVTAEAGVEYWTNFQLEALLNMQPDVIIMGQEVRGSRSLSTEILRHPALVSFLKTRKQIYVPSNLFGCGTPYVTQALQRITNALTIRGAKQ